jgi:hypothetical protein
VAKTRAKKAEPAENGLEQLQRRLAEGLAEERAEDPPPWLGAPQATESQLEFLRLRAGREDYKTVITAITVVPDP